jgi:GntR family transcriptional regulator/MocR family aminotransferase
MDRFSEERVSRTSLAIELLVDLDRDDREPLRRQLERRLRAAIRDGSLPVGIKLPSTRALAAQLAVSRGVVVEAYDQLVAEGFLAVRQGAVPFVAAGRTERPDEQIGEPSTAYRYDFGANASDTSLFPRRAWLRATERALAELPDAALDYPDPHGVPKLREILGAYLRRVRDVDAVPNRVVVTQGFLQGIDLVCRLLRDRGAFRVAVEDPSLNQQGEVARWYGLTVVPIRCDQDGLDVAALARAEADAVFVTPAHQFPTGAVLAPDRRRRLTAWASTADGLIVENDYDAEFRYDRRPIGAVQGMAPEQTIYLGTTSKTLAPGLRLGWIVTPGRLTASLAMLKHHADGGSPAITQHALARFVDCGDYDRHIRRCRHEYRRRRDALAAAVATELPELRLEGIAAGLHAILLLPEGTDDEVFACRARERGCGVRSVSSYRLSPGPGQPGLVLGYSQLPTASIAPAIRALAEVLACWSAR